MKLLTPEIVYHNIKPIYCCDIQPKSDDFHRLATGGLDNAVRLWKVPFDTLIHSVPLVIELVANLCRHEKGVNSVRWSPSGMNLASASSDGIIIIWTKIDGKYDENNDLNDNEVRLEAWHARFLRRHILDVYDLCWSSDDRHLISGSIDNSAIKWNLSNARTSMLREHRQFVQGVAWDPLGKFVVTQSADRTLRVYSSTSENCIYKVWKNGDDRLFQDGSWRYFFRRLQFSPDGKLLIAPAGVSTDRNANIASSSSHCAHIFLRNNLAKVAVTIPTGVHAVIGVRFNPIRFTLRKVTPPTFNLPYRWLFCVVLDTGVLVFDTEQPLPIVKVTNIHCLSLNDAAWSPDGHCLVLCSTDGYCSYLFFEKGELGEPFALANSNHIDARRMASADSSISSHDEPTEPSRKEPARGPDPALESTEILAREDGDTGCEHTAPSVTARGAVKRPGTAALDEPSTAKKRRVTFTTVT